MVMVFVPAAPKGVKVMAVGTELPLVKAKVPELVPVLAAKAHEAYKDFLKFDKETPSQASAPEANSMGEGLSHFLENDEKSITHSFLQVQAQVGDPPGKGSLSKGTATELIHQLTQKVMFALTQHFTLVMSPWLKDLLCGVDMARSMEDFVLQKLQGSLLSTLPTTLTFMIPTAIEKLLPGMLLSVLTPVLTEIVTRGLTHALTPVFTLTLGRSTKEHYACYHCHAHPRSEYCKQCPGGSKALAYQVYSSDFYASYYSDYYATMYSGQM